ncbi:unnamed protein product [Rhizoctonia solani]|uniref:Transmembrane protein n=1 Tax=Rhizoctonia solani TaxID=456999 RepID=A0A8H3H4L5_9AGAM|nr:unnamed protein product [Rhizoctonia solani]
MFPLEYNIGHPFPGNKRFLFPTIMLIMVALPTLFFVNLITLGLEVVPSLQTQYQPNGTLLNNWWATHGLRRQLRPDLPPCEPKDIGRGDTFRLSTSLFDYKVMSAWETSNASEASGVPEQQRVQYRGEPFASCYVNGAGFEYDRNERTQIITVGVECPGSQDFPVYLSMQTSMTFSWDVHSHFVGQYYGPGQGMQRFIQRTSPNDYRKLVLAALEVISVDSLTIVKGQHVSNPALNIKIYLNIDPDTGAFAPSSSTWTYLNGTQPDSYPDEAGIYDSTLLNLLFVSIDAVSLDLGSHRSSTIFTNTSRLHDMISPNRAPPGVNVSDWANGTKSFNYGLIVPPYQTWAEMLLNDRPVKLGNATGMPDKSVMATTYLCPIYQVKSPGSLVTLVFVGIASMLMSIWTVWKFILTHIATRIEEPHVYMYCVCSDCKRRKKEAEEPQLKGEKKGWQGWDGVVDRTRIWVLERFKIIRDAGGRTKPDHPEDRESRSLLEVGRDSVSTANTRLRFATW